MSLKTNLQTKVWKYTNLQRNMVKMTINQGGYGTFTIGNLV